MSSSCLGVLLNNYLLIISKVIKNRMKNGVGIPCDNLSDDPRTGTGISWRRMKKKNI
jgi:hypothetical protein